MCLQLVHSLHHSDQDLLSVRDSIWTRMRAMMTIQMQMSSASKRASNGNTSLNPPSSQTASISVEPSTVSTKLMTLYYAQSQAAEEWSRNHPQPVISAPSEREPQTWASVGATPPDQDLLTVTSRTQQVNLHTTSKESATEAASPVPEMQLQNPNSSAATIDAASAVTVHASYRSSATVGIPLIASSAGVQTADNLKIATPMTISSESVLRRVHQQVHTRVGPTSLAPLRRRNTAVSASTTAVMTDAPRIPSMIPSVTVTAQRALPSHLASISAPSKSESTSAASPQRHSTTHATSTSASSHARRTKVTTAAASPSTSNVRNAASGDPTQAAKQKQ
jgi:hypothetical protein